MGHFTEELISNCTPDEMIFSAKERITGLHRTDIGDVGIVNEGILFLESVDENGVRRILDYYTKGDIFIKSGFAFCGNTEYFLYARTKCRVSFLSYEKLEKYICTEEKVRQLRQYFDVSFNRQLSHIHILEQHSMRQKIAAFFENERTAANRNPFMLRISFTDCADYIAADRSAMMREIKNMEKDGLIKKKGRLVKLLGI